MRTNDVCGRVYRATIHIWTSPPSEWQGSNIAHIIASRLRREGYEVVLDETSLQRDGVTFYCNPAGGERHRILGILLAETDATVSVGNHYMLHHTEYRIYIGHRGGCLGGHHKYANPFKH